MNEKYISTILKDHKLKKTPARTSVLEVLLSEDFALGVFEIKSRCDVGIDRITLYRTLQTFENSGIIHKITDSNGASKYALCSEDCPTIHHEHRHIHLHCNICGKTFCNEDSDLPNVKVPPGFQLTGVKIIAEGICYECNQS